MTAILQPNIHVTPAFFSLCHRIAIADEPSSRATAHATITQTALGADAREAKSKATLTLHRDTSEGNIRPRLGEDALLGMAADVATRKGYATLLDDEDATLLERPSGAVDSTVDEGGARLLLRMHAALGVAVDITIEKCRFAFCRQAGTVLVAINAWLESMTL